MIVQIVEMERDSGCEHLDDGKCQQHRIVGEIDTDSVFWAYAEFLDNGEWVRDDGVVSYQRDSIAVPNLEYDPDVALFFAGQGLAKVGDVRTYDDWVKLQKQVNWENRVDGECEICHHAYPANCTCPSDVDCPNCLAGSLCIFH
jgi:hypothetical protein